MNKLIWRAEFVIAFGLILIFVANSSAQRQPKKQSLRQMEKLGRGVIAVNQGDGKVFVGWRLFGTDADDLAFNLYRETDGKAVKLNDKPIPDVTFFIDDKADIKKLPPILCARF